MRTRPIMASSSGTPDLRERVLGAARSRLLTYGYSALTMDELATELGVSKKTLYVHFPSKDALVEEIFRGFAGEIRNSADALFRDTTLSFPVKLHRFFEAMAQRFSRISPAAVRDLQRAAPHIYRHVEELRNKNIPHVFGQILRSGQAAGLVRSDIDPAFAIEFWRPAIQSLMHPDTFERLRLAPDQVFTRAINLFFGGLLTSAGRKDYEKHFAS